MSKAPETSSGLSEQARRDLIRGAIGVVAFLVLSLALLLGLNPGARWKLVQGIVGHRADAPLDLTVVHTNDSWGYTQACG